MKTTFHLSLMLLAIFSCKEKPVNEFERIIVSKELKNDSVFQYYRQDQNNNIGMNQQFVFYNIKSFSSDYKPNITLVDDTLNIELNNYNGNFGNGILIRVFNGKYMIKSIDPHVIKGAKFENYELVSQKLSLDKDSFKMGDSLYGNIEFVCRIPDVKTKEMKGFFRTVIK